MALVVRIFLFCLATCGMARAQFVPTLLENRSYWGEGKSEIDFYQADFPRDGESHQCELLMILTPLFIDPNSLAHVEAGKQSGSVPAIRMMQTATLPRGLTVEQRSIDALWRMDSMSLARLSFVGNDVNGNMTKTVREHLESNRVNWDYVCDSYLGTKAQPIALGTKPTVAYEELPLRVRTLDLTKAAGEFDIDLADTLGSPNPEFGGPKSAKISWKVEERTIHVEVQHSAGKDQFILDSNFPFLLREWKAADGTHWKMKNSIRADYKKYLRNGDRERAWKDPMLRHPD